MRFAQKVLAFLMMPMLLSGMCVVSAAGEGQPDGSAILARDAEW